MEHKNLTPDESTQLGTAYFASGCFWGTEYHFKRAKGVVSTSVGYEGGKIDNPTYEQVSTGTTGHAETAEVVYVPSIISYEQLIRLFFETHNFTQLNRQGSDVGTQYRSVIFYKNDEQKRIALEYKDKLNAMGYAVATSIEPASTFWKAEKYHQQYYNKRGGVPYCHVYRKIFTD
ncbi:MAG: peptide-methionine (S)-S-oxide reductase MsrA [Prevotellaceae bacterium]|nr:peptide-methionine (S)-S-oxide reductase MsrA [Prevotellaceae bacterium]